jgi:hypothetical protein
MDAAYPEGVSGGTILRLGGERGGEEKKTNRAPTARASSASESRRGARHSGQEGTALDEARGIVEGPPVVRVRPFVCPERGNAGRGSEKGSRA